MRKKAIVYIVLIFAVLPALALSKDSAQAAFKKANALYAKGQYAQAAALYQKINDLGLSSFTLYYNMGNAYFKSNQIASALLYYNKAYKINPNNEDLNYNIKFAEKQTVDKIETNKDFFLYSWWRNAFLLFSLNTWAIILFISLLLSALGFIFYFYTHTAKSKKFGFYSGLVLLAIASICFILGSVQYHYFNSTKSGIIFDLSVTVKSAPKNGKKLFILHQGTKVEIEQKQDDDINIALPNGKSGWISAKAVREI